MLQRTFLLSCLLPLALCGHQANGQSNELEPIYPLVQFSVFVWSDGGIMRGNSELTGIPRTFYDAPNGAASLISLYKNRSTPLLPYQGPQPLVLYDIEKVRVDPPKHAPPGTKPTLVEKRIPKIRAEIPEGLDRAMLVVFPGRKEANGTLQTIVLPYDSNKVRPGMTRILNSTNQLLAVKFADNEEDMLKLNPKEALDFTPGEITNSKNPRIFIYGLDENQRPRLMHTNRINFKEDSTNYFIVFPEGTRRVRIKNLGAHKIPLSALAIE